MEAEDEGLAEIEEQDGTNMGSPYKPRRDSVMSVGTEQSPEKKDNAEIRNIGSNSNYRRSNLAGQR